VPGVGERKAGDFGDRFLAAIERYSEEHGLARDVVASGAEVASR
jgi:hypothetical protein